MKKIVSVLLALLMLLSLGACKVETGMSSSEDTSSTATVNPADYDLNLAGLFSLSMARLTTLESLFIRHSRSMSTSKSED